MKALNEEEIKVHTAKSQAAADEDLVLWNKIPQDPSVMLLAENSSAQQNQENTDEDKNKEKVVDDADEGNEGNEDTLNLDDEEKEEETDKEEDEETEEQEAAEETNDSDVEVKEQTEDEECIKQETQEGEVLSDDCKKKIMDEPTASGEEESDGDGQGALIPIGFGDDSDVTDEDFEFSFDQEGDAVVIVFIDEDVIRDFLIAEGDDIPPELQPLEASNDSFETFGNTSLESLFTTNVVPPVILDLDGDGVELLDSKTSNFQIDVTGDNKADQIGWAGNDDGVLIYDADGNMDVTSADEFVFTRYDAAAKTDIEGLKSAFDSNNDGYLDAGDSKYSSFAVWQDANGNGTVDTGEFQSLSALNISSINLNTTSDLHVENNSFVFGTGEYTMNGKTSTYADVGLDSGDGSINGSTYPVRLFVGSVLDNDDGTDVTVTGVSNVTPGAVVVMNADGTFTYTPPPGLTDVIDTFTYTIQDNLGQTADGTVSVDISGMIWYVDNTADGPGTGTSDDPFTSLEVFNSKNRPDGEGDWIFLSSGEGNYDGGITLLNNQNLIGEGSNLFFNGVTLNVSGTAPTVTNTGIENGGSGVVLSDGTNIIDGFNIGPTTGPSIGINTQGDATFNNLMIDGAPGGGLIVDSEASGTYTFNGVTITNVGGVGLEILNNSLGTFNFNNVDINGAVGAGVHIANNDATINIDGLSVNNVLSNGLPGAGVLIGKNAGPVNFLSQVDISGTEHGVLIDGTSGDVTFNGLDVSNTSAMGPGICILNTTNGTFIFNGLTSVDSTLDSGVILDNNNNSMITFNTLDVINTEGKGDAIVINNNNSDIDFGETTATNNLGQAVKLIGDIGSTVDFNSLLNVNHNTGNTGIEILNNSAGTFTFSGVSIDGAQEGIFIQNNSSNISFTDTLIQNIGGMGNGLVALNNSSTFTFTNLDSIDNFGNNVFLDQNSSSTFNFSNLNINGSASSPTIGEGFIANDSGTINITGSTNIINTLGAIGLDIQGTNIGSSGVIFESISVDGAKHGIVLNNVGGSGSFTVTGDGTNAGSGGTIQNTTDSAVEINNVFVPVSLNFMNLPDNSSGSLLVINSNNVGLFDSNISGKLGTSVNAIDLNYDDDNVHVINIKGNTLDGIIGDQPVVRLTASSFGTDVDLNLDNNLFQNLDLSNNGNPQHAVLTESTSGSIVTNDINNNTFNGQNSSGPNTFANGILIAAVEGTQNLGIVGNKFQNSDSMGPNQADTIELIGFGGGIFDGAITKNTFENNLNSNSIVISMPDPFGSFPDMITQLDITDNYFDNIPGRSALIVDLGPNVSDSSINFSGNFVGTSNPNVGSGGADNDVPVIYYNIVGPDGISGPPLFIPNHNFFMTSNNITTNTEDFAVVVDSMYIADSLIDISDNNVNHNGSNVSLTNSTFLILNDEGLMELKLLDNVVTLPSIGLGNFHFEIFDFFGGISLDPFTQTAQFPEDIISLNNLPTLPSEVLFASSGNLREEVQGTTEAPIVLDLDGDGIELLAPNVSPVVHELSGLSIGWVAPDDAFLVYDANRDGAYSGLQEINFASYHPDAYTDLDGLRLAFDDNNDGVINSQDDVFKDLAVWQDKNQNGSSELGEFTYLNESAIASLGLGYDLAPTLLNGNVNYGSSTYTLNDGTVAELGNIGLAVGQSLTVSDLLGICSECSNTIPEPTPLPTQNSLSDPLETNQDYLDMGL
jgi:hypothetical protein